ncbi:Hypothetical predicted protein [Paramuricea clavata]|uniref:Uncharacterized protein n=1 Tax=Paramuricea clavata TaxID=317549 RepID=A0A6S7H428_PARCT|nr:Hypothetical predicted protein [Paramuricea clavata]
MNIGNELYSNLSCLAGQSFLLFTELPSQLTVFDTDFVLEHSESYGGNIIGDCSIEGYQYCVPFDRSFEMLLAEHYCAFILTIDSNAVCIFSTNDGKYKVFDSHSRDIYGRSHPQAYDDDSSPTCTTHYIKNIKDKHTLVDAIFNLVTTKIKDEIVNFEIQFLACSSELTNCGRKRIMKKHRQNYINDFIEPALKKQKLDTKQMKYKTMAKEKKQKLLAKNMNYKETMSKEQKQKVRENKRVKYEAMDQSKKEELLANKMNYKETMSKEQKQKVRENKRVMYEAMDQSKKEELLAKNMNYKETMSKEQKQKVRENKRIKYEAMDQSKKEELLAKNMNYK